MGGLGMNRSDKTAKIARAEIKVVKAAMMWHSRQPRELAPWFESPLSLRVILDDIDKACEDLMRARKGK